MLRTDLQSEYFSWGACVTPLTSFIGHSCNPNAKACFSSDQKLIVYSLQTIKKNSQVSALLNEKNLKIIKGELINKKSIHCVFNYCRYKLDISTHFLK